MHSLLYPDEGDIWGQSIFDSQNHTDEYLKTRHNYYELRKGFSYRISPDIVSYLFFHAIAGYHEQNKDDILKCS